MFYIFVLIYKTKCGTYLSYIHMLCNNVMFITLFKKDSEINASQISLDHFSTKVVGTES